MRLGHGLSTGCLKSVQVNDQMLLSIATTLVRMLAYLTGVQTPCGVGGQALTQIEMSHASFVNGRVIVSWAF